MSDELLQKVADYLKTTVAEIKRPSPDDLAPPESNYMMRDAPENYEDRLKRRLAEAACGIRGGFGREEAILALEDIIRDAQTLLERFKTVHRPGRMER